MTLEDLFNNKFKFCQKNLQKFVAKTSKCDLELGPSQQLQDNNREKKQKIAYMFNMTT